MKTILWILIGIMALSGAAAHCIDDDHVFERGQDDRPLARVRLTEVVEAGSELLVRVNLVNTGDKDFENIRVGMYMPDLGLFARTHRFDLDEGEGVVKVLFFDSKRCLPRDILAQQNGPVWGI